jgi:hypothetical protein
MALKYDVSIFDVGVTFWNERTEYGEIYISIDQDCGVAAPFKWTRERQGSGETERREREKSECASVGQCWQQHQLTSTTTCWERERGREHIETHMVNGMGIKQCGGLFD